MSAKVVKRWLSCCFSGMCLIGLAVSPVQGGEGTTAGSLFSLLGGARLASLGGAGLALSGEVSAVSLNPALLPTIPRRAAHFLHRESEEGIRYDSLLLADPHAHLGSWSVNLHYLSFGSFVGRDATGHPTEEFSASEVLAGMSYGTPLAAWLSIGATANTFTQILERTQATTVAFDLGVQVHPVSAPWEVAIVLQHFGPGLKLIQEVAALPTTLRMGGKFDVTPWFTTVLDTSWSPSSQLTWQAGSELHPLPSVWFRVGYASTTAQLTGSGFTFGGGLGIDQSSLDYAYVPMGVLGGAHRFSMTWGF